MNYRALPDVTTARSPTWVANYNDVRLVKKIGHVHESTSVHSGRVLKGFDNGPSMRNIRHGNPDGRQW